MYIHASETKVFSCQNFKFEKQDCSLMWVYWNSLKSTAGARRVKLFSSPNPKDVYKKQWQMCLEILLL